MSSRKRLYRESAPPWAKDKAERYRTPVKPIPGFGNGEPKPAKVKSHSRMMGIVRPNRTRIV